eukprot:GHVT01074114.1.p1 GENE.GHVT01074114.1~~GHVT01074114.1.p1  ORF type:complete len:103 (-),score=4.52 GHVT01074114.1:132-440(-)
MTSNTSHPIVLQALVAPSLFCPSFAYFIPCSRAHLVGSVSYTPTMSRWTRPPHWGRATSALAHTLQQIASPGRGVLPLTLQERRNASSSGRDALGRLRSDGL